MTFSRNYLGCAPKQIGTEAGGSYFLRCLVRRRLNQAPPGQLMLGRSRDLMRRTWTIIRWPCGRQLKLLPVATLPEKASRS